MGFSVASEEDMTSFIILGSKKASEGRLLSWVLKEAQELSRRKVGRPFQAETQRREIAWLAQGSRTTQNGRSKWWIWRSSIRNTYWLWEYRKMVGERWWGPKVRYQVLVMEIERKGQSLSHIGRWPWKN